MDKCSCCGNNLRMEGRMREIAREELARALKEASAVVRPPSKKLVYSDRAMLDAKRAATKDSRQSNH